MSKTQAQLLAEINSSITTNGTGAITGAVLNTVLQDMVNATFGDAVLTSLIVNGTSNLTGATTIGGALTYGGVALSNSVTGTGSMVLSASPALTGSPILAAASATTLVIGAGSAITSSGAGGALGSNAFTSTSYMPLAGGTFTGGIGFSVTNTLDIGTSATVLAPRTIYAGTSFIGPIGTFTTSVAIGGATIGSNALAVTGAINLGSGGVTNPGGMWTSTGSAGLSFGGGAVTTFGLSSTSILGWTSGANSTAAPDTILARDAANTLAQRNGTTAQALRVYNSFTDASNGSYGFIQPGRTFSNVLDIGSTGNGTGAAVLTGLSFFADGTNRLNYNVSESAKWSMSGGLVTAGTSSFGAASSTTTFANLGAGTTGVSSLRFLQGVAPTSPVDGDMWREDNTNTGLKVRINGVTKTVTVA